MRSGERPWILTGWDVQEDKRLTRSYKTRDAAMRAQQKLGSRLKWSYIDNAHLLPSTEWAPS